MVKAIQLTKPHALVHTTEKVVLSVYMSVKDFLPIERNPHQRCERLRTDKKHLRKLVPTHWSVDMAILPDGSQYKLNGHTRSFMWEKEKLERPPYLCVNVYSYDTIEDVTAACEHFDNNAAAKKGADTMQSGAHKAGIEFRTAWLKQGKYASMLDVACANSGVSLNTTPKIDRVGLFKSELRMLDKIPDLNHKNFPIGFGAGALMALRKHGALAIGFITAFNLGQGVNNHGKKDAVQFLTEYLAEKRAGKMLAGVENNNENCAFFLSCLDRYLNGDKKVTKRPNMIDLKSYMPASSKVRVRPAANSNLAISIAA